MCELLLVLMMVDYINIVMPQPVMSYIMLCYNAFINNVQYFAYAYDWENLCGLILYQLQVGMIIINYYISHAKVIVSYKHGDQHVKTSTDNDHVVEITIQLRMHVSITLAFNMFNDFSDSLAMCLLIMLV